MTLEGPRRVSSVLVVDDSDADQTYCQLMLERSSRYPRVHAARDAQQALELLTDPKRGAALRADPFPPPLLFLDINMPGMSGFEFLAELEQRKAGGSTGIPATVVMLTSSDERRDRVRASQSPLVREFLVKPLSVERAIEIADRFGDIAGV